MENTWVIIVAGGQGNRFGSQLPKQFLSLDGKLVLEYSLDFFSDLGKLGGVVLVLPENYVAEWQARLASSVVQVTAGGARRQDSVAAGLALVPESAQWIAVHDAARPFVDLKIFQDTLQAAQEFGAAVTATPLSDTLKKANDSHAVVETIPRQNLYRIQTPQIFDYLVLRDALQWAIEEDVEVTDEATLLEQMGKTVQVVMGSDWNFKITRSSDLQLAEAILQQKRSTTMSIRIGEGYDVHQFTEGRDLILGGVKIPFEQGLLGHSDADALLHAIADALLGAIAAGDLGAHFPDSDPQYKGMASLEILDKVWAMVEKKGFRLANVDATLICQRPKLAAHIPAMRLNIARALQVDLGQISVKATTEEGLGFTGKMEGLAARAVVLLQGPNLENAMKRKEL